MNKRDRIRALKAGLVLALTRIAAQADELESGERARKTLYRSVGELTQERDQALADAAADARNFARAAKEGQHGPYPWEEWYNRQTERLVVVEGERDRFERQYREAEESVSRLADNGNHFIKEGERLQAERDEARAEVERLTAENGIYRDEIDHIQRWIQGLPQDVLAEVWGKRICQWVTSYCERLRSELDAMTTERDSLRDELKTTRASSWALLAKVEQERLDLQRDLRRVLAETAPPMPTGAPETAGEDGGGETATPGRDGTVEVGTLTVGTEFIWVNGRWNLRLKVIEQNPGVTITEGVGSRTRRVINRTERVTVVPPTPSKTKRSNATAKEAG